MGFDPEDFGDLFVGAGVVSSFLRLEDVIFLVDLVSCIYGVNITSVCILVT